MSMLAAEDFGSGLGYAATLLQVPLGIGLALVIVGAAGRSSQCASWDATLRSAAAAAGPVPLLAAFAMVQAGSTRSDILTFVGLGAATASVLLGVLLCLLLPALRLAVADVNSKTGEIICESFDDGTRRAHGLAIAARAISSLRFLGSALLVFGALPTGTQLLCSSALLRLALGIHAACAAMSALGTSRRELVAAAEHAAKVAPLAAGMGLMDFLAYDEASWLHAPVQPVVYTVAAAIGQIALILAATGGAQEPLRAEFDLGLRATFADMLANVTTGALYVALAAAAVRVLAGTFAVQASLSGFSIEWGAPLLAGASLLAALYVLVHLMEIVLVYFPGTAHAANGVTNGTKPHADTTMAHVKAVVAPVSTLALALLTVHMSQPASTGSVAESTLLLATLPLRYGFVLVAAGIGLQVITLAIFTLAHCDEEPAPQPPFDGSGCLRWEPEGATACRVAEGVRWATLALLAGGLALGWVGLGALPWLGLGLAAAPVYVLLPADGKEAARGVAETMVAGLKYFLESLASCAGVGQQALTALAERRAAEKAAAIMAEMAEVERKKASKGAGKGKANKRHK